MKDIKVNYIDTAKPMINNVIQDERMQFIHDRLCKYYNVIITDERPDIVFCDVYGIDFAKYDCIRVGMSVEEYAPDFNLYDYILTIFDEFEFKDRVFNFRVIVTMKYCRDINDLALIKHHINKADLDNKTEFCSFVQSKGVGADPRRIEFFHKLSQYKKVNSGGRVLNNIGYRVDDKLLFESIHKFSISFINGLNYTIQDRPLDAYAAKTVPIYWGNRDIGKLFNKGSFINCHDYDSFDDVVEHIKVIDNDDELYLKMLQTPAYINPVTTEQEIERLDKFLINIVENGTVQRSGVYWNKLFEKEAVIGRKKMMRIAILSHKFQPVTKHIFKSKMGKQLKRIALKYLENKSFKDVYND